MNLNPDDKENFKGYFSLILKDIEDKNLLIDMSNMIDDRISELGNLEPNSDEYQRYLGKKL